MEKLSRSKLSEITLNLLNRIIASFVVGFEQMKKQRCMGLVSVLNGGDEKNISFMPTGGVCSKIEERKKNKIKARWWDSKSFHEK